MTKSEFYKNQAERYRETEKSADLPSGFKAAMRFNALQRGMKWKETYKLTSGLGQE